jgi:hypothetical protein
VEFLRQKNSSSADQKNLPWPERARPLKPPDDPPRINGCPMSRIRLIGEPADGASISSELSSYGSNRRVVTAQIRALIPNAPNKTTPHKAESKIFRIMSRLVLTLKRRCAKRCGSRFVPTWLYRLPHARHQ